MDAELLALFLRADEEKLAEGVIEIPWNELELAGLVEIGAVVLANGKDAVEGREPDGDGHVTGKFLEVDIVANFRGKLFVGGAVQQLAEIDHAILLLGREAGLCVVDLFVAV